MAVLEDRVLLAQPLRTVMAKIDSTLPPIISPSPALRATPAISTPATFTPDNRTRLNPLINLD